MNCIRCGKEVDLLKNHVVSMQEDKIIGYIHMSCFNKQFKGKDNEEIES